MADTAHYTGHYDADRDVIRITVGDPTLPVEGRDYGWGVVQTDASGTVVALEVRNVRNLVAAGNGEMPDFDATWTGYGRIE